MVSDCENYVICEDTIGVIKSGWTDRLLSARIKQVYCTYYNWTNTSPIFSTIRLVGFSIFFVYHTTETEDKKTSNSELRSAGTTNVTNQPDGQWATLRLSKVSERAPRFNPQVPRGVVPELDSDSSLRGNDSE